MQPETLCALAETTISKHFSLPPPPLKYETKNAKERPAANADGCGDVIGSLPDDVKLAIIDTAFNEGLTAVRERSSALAAKAAEASREKAAARHADAAAKAAKGTRMPSSSSATTFTCPP